MQSWVYLEGMFLWFLWYERRECIYFMIYVNLIYQETLLPLLKARPKNRKNITKVLLGRRGSMLCCNCRCLNQDDRPGKCLYQLGVNCVPPRAFNSLRKGFIATDRYHFERGLRLGRFRTHNTGLINWPNKTERLYSSLPSQPSFTWTVSTRRQGIEKKTSIWWPIFNLQNQASFWC